MIKMECRVSVVKVKGSWSAKLVQVVVHFLWSNSLPCLVLCTSFLFEILFINQSNNETIGKRILVQIGNVRHSARLCS